MRNGAENEKDECRVELSLDIPAEVVAIIAEHLIGQYSFGTAASVNVLSKAIHCETLPVLYEAFFFEHHKDRGYYRDVQELPDGLRYTKFVFMVTEDTTRAGYIADKFTEIIMTITVNTNLDQDLNTDYANQCDIRLHRSISSATAFQIIETPIQSPARDHAACKFQGLGSALYYSSSAFRESWMKTQPTAHGCVAEEGRPQVRPVEAIRYVFLEKGAILLPSSLAGDQSFATNLCLGGTRVIMDEGNDNEGDMLNTSIELLKLVAMQAHPTHLAEREKQMVTFHVLSLNAERACKYARSWPEFHLDITVSQHGLDEFIRKLEVALPIMPAIAKNRILISLTGRTNLPDLKTYIYTFENLYSPYITSLDMVLPSRYADPISTLLRIDTPTQLDPSPPRRPVSLALKMTRWSGRVKVVAGKDSSVALESDFQDLAQRYGALRTR